MIYQKLCVDNILIRANNKYNCHNYLSMDTKKDPIGDINNAFIESAKNGDLDNVIFLLDSGADIHADNDYTLRWSA